MMILSVAFGLFILGLGFVLGYATGCGREPNQ